MSKKLLISNSIMWSAAILVVAIVEEKQFAIFMLVILAITSLMFLKKVKVVKLVDGDTFVYSVTVE